jgi:hypothetical protein
MHIFILISSAFNIFQAYQNFTIYRWYLYSLNWNNFHEYLIQHSLKSGGTKDRFRQIQVLYQKAYIKPMSNNGTEI